jgi:hypothetical protein
MEYKDTLKFTACMQIRDPLTQAQTQNVAIVRFTVTRLQHSNDGLRNSLKTVMPFMHIAKNSVLKVYDCEYTYTAVGAESGSGLDEAGSNPGKEKEFLYSPKRPDRLWGPLTLRLPD